MKAKVVIPGIILATISATALFMFGCGSSASLFNPAFVNRFAGGSFPLTPGPNAAFVLVRVVNDTDQTAEFIVTVDQQVIETDDEGNYLFNEDTGEPITREVRQTKRLLTQPNAPANDVGVLFECGEFPVVRVGLGEDLLPTDAAVYVGGGGVGGATGFGIPTGDLNPLELFDYGNFNCGDTIIFRAFRSVGVAGGVGLQVFLLPGSEQPSAYTGPNTFANLEAFLEAQSRD